MDEFKTVLKCLLNFDDDLLNKIVVSCKSLDDLYNQKSNLNTLYDLNSEQIDKCKQVLNFYRIVQIYCNDYMKFCQIFNKKENLNDFCNFDAENLSINKDNQEKMIMYSYVFNEAIKSELQYGDILFVNKDNLNNLRLMVYIGDWNVVCVYEFQKYFDTDMFLNVLKNENKNFGSKLISLKNTNMIWNKCTANLMSDQIEHKIDFNNFKQIFQHNMKCVDSLKTGDVVKLEGYKLFDSYVTYHHTVLITSKHF
jgi:hypothetical protein